jgi:MinD-like ATPase involved in chromosome partitioning or flagellar assembly
MVDQRQITNHAEYPCGASLTARKGGVGKSLIASLLAQFYKDRGVHAICVDTDQYVQRFSSITR